MGLQGKKKGKRGRREEGKGGRREKRGGERRKIKREERREWRGEGWWWCVMGDNGEQWVEEERKGVQEGLKKLTINDHDSASPETDSKDTDAHITDILIKALPLDQFVSLRTKLGVIRGGSTSAGRSFRLRDEDIEILEPPPVAPKKKIVTRGGKVKQTAQRKLDIPTAESSDEQLEGQSSEENIAGGNEEPEQVVQGDKAVTRSSAKRKRSAKRKSTPQSKKNQFSDPSDDQQNEGNTTGSQKTPEPSTRKSPTTRTEAQNVEASATQTSNRKRSGKDPVSQPVEEPTPLPKVIDDEARDRFEKSASRSFVSNSEVISLLEDLKQHVLLIEEGPTTGTETTPASSSQPKDKGKAPAIEESDEDSDEETEEEEDPAQFSSVTQLLQ
nr:protein IWS1 homolog [Coffea arabica]